MTNIKTLAKLARLDLALFSVCEIVKNNLKGNVFTEEN